MVNNLGGLILAFEEILKLPHSPKEKGDGFDARVLEILIQVAGFQREAPPKTINSTKKKIGKTREQQFQEWNKDGRWIIIYQPNGSQKSPDFVLVLGGLGILEVEAKRHEDNTPMWNDGHPVPGRICVFNGDDDTQKDTTIVMGDDIINDRDLAFITEGKRLLKEFTEERRALAKREGIRWPPKYCRPQHEPEKEDAELLRHPDRKQREMNVFTYVRKIGNK